MGLYLAAYCRGTLVILPRYQPPRRCSTRSRASASRCSPASPTIFVGLMALRGVRHADLLEPPHLLLRLLGPAGGDAARAGRRATGCTDLRRLRPDRSRPGADLQPARTACASPARSASPCRAPRSRSSTSTTGTRARQPVEPGRDPRPRPADHERLSQPARETAAALRDGWLHTGDIGAFDADGYLSIRDRKKDMAIVGGFNVYPREVEEALCSHPACRRGRRGRRADSYRGESVRAYVVGVKEWRRERKTSDGPLRCKPCPLQGPGLH